VLFFAKMTSSTVMFVAHLRSIASGFWLGGLPSKFQSLNYTRNLVLDSQCKAKEANLILKKHVRKPFIIFSGERLGDLMKKNPGVRLPDLSRMLGQQWRELSEPQKEIYRLRYKDEKQNLARETSAELQSLAVADKK